MIRVRRHPHADADGWTFVRPATEPGSADQQNIHGFTRSALAPHTDRSFEEAPPALLCLLMLEASAGGGEVLLADACEALRGFSPDVVSAAQNDLWLADARGRSRRPVLHMDDGLCIGRYRTDHLASPRAASKAADEVLAALGRLATSARRLSLRPGDGYVIHNHRMLHGRTAFTGHRRCARLLASVAPDSSHEWLNRGFRIGAR